MATSVNRAQQEAIEAAREIALKQRSEMLVQGRSGQVRKGNTYGDDPYPSKG